MRFPSNLVCEFLVAYRLRIYINVDILPPPPPPSVTPRPPSPPPLPPLPVESQNFIKTPSLNQNILSLNNDTKGFY